MKQKCLKLSQMKSQSYKSINEKLNSLIVFIDEYNKELLLNNEEKKQISLDLPYSINSCSEEFLEFLWSEVESLIINQSGQLVKDQTELYNTFNFLLKAMINLDENKISFVKLFLVA